MSDLLMKNEEMPEACENCYIASCICYRDKNDKKGYWACMSILDDDNSIEDALDRGDRSSKCPLVEVKPHGRLVDADKLTDTIISCIRDAEKEYPKKDFGMVKMVYESCLYHIGKAPTVLEASNGKE